MSKRLRLFIVFAILVFCAYLLYPTISYYRFVPQEKKDLAISSKDVVRAKVSSMVETDFKDLMTAFIQNKDQKLDPRFDYLKPVAIKNIKALKKVGSKDAKVPSKWTVNDLVRAFFSEADLKDEMSTGIRNEYEKVKDQSNSIMQLGLDLKGGISVTIKPDFEAYAKTMADEAGNVPVLTQEEKDLALDKAMIVLNNRIDAFGVVEPQIRKTGDSILVEVPGEPNFDRVNKFLGGKGSINFYLVNSAQTDALRSYIASNGSDSVNENYQPLDSSVIPAGMMAYPVYKTNEYEEEEKTGYRVVGTTVNDMLEGRYIKSVSAVRGSDQQPLVVFELTAKGGEVFYTLTSQNIGNELAIVMDGKIKAVATIRAALSTNVQMEGFGAEESLYLEKILKAASLPVPLMVVNQEVVGATLGEEAIQTGLYAGLIGFLLVVGFMLLYYKGAGVIANIALSLNVIILAALLSGFRQTITLNSIAAFVLTLGMAVDANVIIFERIKEELRLGKSAQAAVGAGYSKAFWTIIDSNITTFIAALFLSFVGSGPIQGFAVTLAIGIATSMFTSLFISRLFFDFFIEQIKVKKISISWRKLA